MAKMVLANERVTARDLLDRVGMCFREFSWAHNQYDQARGLRARAR